MSTHVEVPVVGAGISGIGAAAPGSARPASGTS